MVKPWQSFTVGTEISIMADSTLVTISTDIRRLVGATGTITIDTSMTLVCHTPNLDVLVEGNHAVARVSQGCLFYTSGTVVKVRAIQTLVTNPIDVLH